MVSSSKEGIKNQEPFSGEEKTVSQLSLSADPPSDQEDLLAPVSGYKFKFDFDAGYLVKSPCKKCPRLPELPQCADNCRILFGIHSVLSRIISCSRRR